MRFTPQAEPPFVCSSAFYVIQAGIQYDVRLLTSSSDSGLCTTLFVPTTAILGQWTNDPPFDDGQAFTLLFDDTFSDYVLDVAAREPWSDLVPDPAALNFGPVVPPAEVSQSMTFHNAGTGILSLMSVQITGPHGDQFSFAAPNCSMQQIPPGTFCQTQVRYAPTTYGEHTANLTVDSNDPATPTVILPLAGRAVDAVTILGARFFDRIQWILLAATSSLAPEVQLFASVQGCFEDMPLRYNGSAYVALERACSGINGAPVIIESNLGGIASATLR